MYTLWMILIILLIGLALNTDPYKMLWFIIWYIIWILLYALFNK